MLTFVFTIAKLIQGNLLQEWHPSGGAAVRRRFCFSKLWRSAYMELDGPAVRPDAARAQAAEPTSEAELLGLDPVALNPSKRGRVAQMVESFVIGWPPAHMIRPRGFGMDPPFKRLRPPYQAVVEMRTNQTRSFGFFARQGVFVAHTLACTDALKGRAQGAADPYADHARDVQKLLARIAAEDKDETSAIETLWEGFSS